MGRMMTKLFSLLLLGGLVLTGCQKTSAPSAAYPDSAPETLKGPELVYGTGMPPGEPPTGDALGNLAPPPENSGTPVDGGVQ